MGFGLDDAGGHIRFTHGENYNLLGGSESTHAEMTRRASRIVEELRRRGYSLDSLAHDQIDEVQTIIDSVSLE